MHKLVNTWRCWHICKGEVVGFDLDQFGGVQGENRGGAAQPAIPFAKKEILVEE